MTVNRHDFGGLMFSTNYELSRIMRRFSYESGLYSGQPRILTILNLNEGCTLSELSELCGIGMPSLSVSLRNMEKTGLIRKESEGRSNYLFLTDTGREKAQAFHGRIDQFFEDILTEFGPEGADQLNESLEKLVAYLRRCAGPEQ